MKMNALHTQTYVIQWKQCKRKVHSTKCLHKEIGEVSYKQFKSILQSSRGKQKQKQKLKQKKPKKQTNKTEANIPKRSRHQEIVKFRAKISKLETRGTIQRINNIDKLLAKLTKGHRGGIQINKIRNEKEDLTVETEEIWKIIRSYYKSLYLTKLGNLNKIDDFLDRCHIPKLNQGQGNYLNSPITSKEIEASIETLPTNQPTNQPTNKQLRAREF